MKKFNIFIGLLLCMSLYSFKSSAQQMTYSDLRSGNGISVDYSIPNYSFNSINYKGEDMKEISFPGFFIPNDEGMPNLPRISRYIAVPQGAKVVVNIKRFTTEVIKDINIAPALRIQVETEEPEMNYVKNKEVYSKNQNYPESPVIVSEPTSVRGVDAVILAITPFQYNPVTKELTVYKDISVDIEFVGGSKQYGDNKYRSPWFDPILQNVFLNYASLPVVDYSKRYQEYYNNKDRETGCEYLIVIPNREDFRTFAEQIKDYRTKQGIITKIMTLSDMGCTTTSAMETFFHNAYNTWDIPPVAVLLMGDHLTNMEQGIPAETVTHPYEGTCISDNPYADVTGDKLPEMVFARLAAENVSQMSILVSKMFEYEQSPCMDTAYYNHPITALGWQTERWFQICSEVVGGYLRVHGKNPIRINAIYDGTPNSIWSSAQNTSNVVSYFGPSGTQYIPQIPSELGGWSGGTAQQVVNAVNNGAYILQHRDHGYESGWGEPNFSSSNVSQLTNVGKMLFLFTINCQTGKFNINGSCFGETFQRYTYNGQNAGAVGFIGPTEVSYSFVNDTYVWGVYDLFDPQFMPDYNVYTNHQSNWLPAFGNVAGKWFLAESSWPYNTSDKDITYQMFTAHCDPFMRLYTQQPHNLSVTHNPTVMAGIAPFLITCTEGATIAITMHDQILAVATATGEEQEIDLPLILPDSTLNVVCTKQDYLRYEDQIVTIPAEGPYIVGRGWRVNDANHDGNVDYAETCTLDYTLKNVGVDTATNVIATISSDDQYITFENNTANFGNVVPDSVITVANAFTITASPVIPDGHVVNCLVTFSSNDQIWTAQLSFTSNAPNFSLLSNGVEGELLPGKTLNITATFVNNGGASIYNASGVYSTTCPYITVNTTTPVIYGDISAHGGIANGSFSITVSPDAPFGTLIPSVVTLSADHAYTCTGEFEPFIDICNVAVNTYPYDEGFEDSELPNCWTQEIVSGNASWSTRDGGLNNHPYHAHSGSYNAYISNEDGAVVKLVSPLINLQGITNPTLSFWHAQSVHNSAQDILRVYYKNSTDGNWILLASYPYSIAAWKKRELTLPNPTSNYYIAFEAECLGGFGVVLDDIEITGEGSTILGDANGDGSVNVNDEMALTYYILGQNPDPFYFSNADVNADGSINIKDIMCIVQIIMNNGKSSYNCDNKTSTAEYTIENGILYLNTPVALGGLQITFDSQVSVIDAMSNFVQSAKWTSNNQYTYIAFSDNGTMFEAGKYPICKVGDAQIVNIVLSTPYGCDVNAEEGSILGVGDVTTVCFNQPYPNPFSGSLNVTYTINSNVNSVEFIITNTNGQIINSNDVENTVTGTHVYTWQPSSQISSGIYFITLNVNGVNVQKVKVVYQK